MDEQELLRQFHHNQSVWLARLASGEMQPATLHPRVQMRNGTLAVRPGSAGVIMLPMEGSSRHVLANHMHALSWLRDQSTRDVLVWAMQPDAEIDLEMLALGYQPSFDPWWMARDLSLPIPDPTHQIRPATLRDIAELLESNVPYVVRDQVENTALLANAYPPDVQWLVAIVDGAPVGHAIVNVVGQHAGLFNVGVHGNYRSRGIGTSLTLSAMQFAKARGAQVMNLNSTPAGKRMYERAGFVQFGTGQTWLRSGPRARQLPPGFQQTQVRAIGRGDVANISIDPLDPGRFMCLMTGQQIAARFGQQESLLEIIRQGSVPEIIPMWKAGLRDEAIAATDNPRAREFTYGPRGATPLHLAVEMGAGTLVMALIDAGANLKARDTEYQATPLDWAHALNKPTIARIIRRAGGT